MSALKLRHQKGFTLIELLVVIVILATLSTVVYVALNPTKRFEDTRNARRFGDVNSIMTAVQQYAVDTDGALPTGVPLTTPAQIGTCTGTGATLCSGAAANCVNLSTDLATYLKSMPVDPETGSAVTTGYSIVKDANNMVTVKACSAEAGEVVEVSR